MKDNQHHLAYEAFAGKNILVVGGAGFIGSNLARNLVDCGANVTVVDGLFPNCGGNLFNLQGYLKDLVFIQGDVGNQELAKDVVRRQDYIYILAGHTSHLDSMNNPLQDLAINVAAKVSILEACRHMNKKARIVYTSTRQIYGRPQILPVPETHSLNPVDVNGINEIAAEHYHILYHQLHDLDITILRLTNVYGPRMHIRDARQNFMGWWFRQLLCNNEIMVYGDGHQMRDLLYVDDVVDALIRSALCPSAIGEIFNLGSPPITLLDLAMLMIEVNGVGSYQVAPFPVMRKKIDIGSYYGDYSKATKLINWTPTKALVRGLKATLDYYREFQDEYL